MLHGLLRTCVISQTCREKTSYGTFIVPTDISASAEGSATLLPSTGHQQSLRQPFLLATVERHFIRCAAKLPDYTPGHVQGHRWAKDSNSSRGYSELTGSLCTSRRPGADAEPRDLFGFSSPPVARSQGGAHLQSAVRIRGSAAARVRRVPWDLCLVVARTWPDAKVTVGSNSACTP